MSSSEVPLGGGMNSPRIQVNNLPTSLRMMPPRSPSRESIVSGSECCWSGFLKAVPESHQQLSAYLTPNRGPSPVPGSGGNRFLKVPNGGGGGISGARSTDGSNWWEEETDLSVIKSCQALSKALGLQKSFSTGDIVTLDDSADHPQGITTTTYKSYHTHNSYEKNVTSIRAIIPLRPLFSIVKKKKEKVFFLCRLDRLKLGIGYLLAARATL